MSIGLLRRVQLLGARVPGRTACLLTVSAHFILFNAATTALNSLAVAVLARECIESQRTDLVHARVSSVVAGRRWLGRVISMRILS